MSDSPYDVLQVSAEASDAEIKGAYRRLVKALHPDSGSPGDIERFRRVQQAYETLSTPERRRAYDRSRGDRVPVSWGAPGFDEPGPRRRGFEEVRGRWPEPDVHFDVVLTEGEVRRGGRLTFETPVRIPCPSCRGAGGDFFGFCHGCAGSGTRRLYERIEVVIPSGIDDGDILTARRRDGGTVRARIRIRQKWGQVPFF